MQAIVPLHVDLSMEERNLLSVAYKQALESRLAAWQAIQLVEDNETRDGNAQGAKYAKEYCSQIEKELDQISGSILNLLDAHLIPGSTTSEAKVFCLKMKADYYSHRTTYLRGEKGLEAADSARTAYQEASDIAEKELTVAHPIRLGLAFNFSVFVREVLVTQSRHAIWRARHLQSPMLISKTFPKILVGPLRSSWGCCANNGCCGRLSLDQVNSYAPCTV